MHGNHPLVALLSSLPHCACLYSVPRRSHSSASPYRAIRQTLTAGARGGPLHYYYYHYYHTRYLLIFTYTPAERGGGIEFNDCLGVSFRGSEDRSVSACSTTRILWRLQLPHDRCARNSAGTLAWIYCSTIAAAPHRQGTRCAHAGEVASSLSSTEAARGERTPASQPASKQAAAELE